MSVLDAAFRPELFASRSNFQRCSADLLYNFVASAVAACVGRLGSAQDSPAGLEKEIQVVALLVMEAQLDSPDWFVLLAELELAVMAAVAQ